jgi:hypothetical protein
MRCEEIDQHLMHEPFVPLRLYVCNGRGYEVHSPGLCLIVRGTIYISPIDRPSRISDDMDVIDCTHITRIEQIDEPAAGRSAPPAQ